MSLDLPVRPSARLDTVKAEGLVLPLFCGTIFLSAFLLFSVQPMFTKMVLPRLGGTPAVWSVAMVFFQGVLLFGYLYAHLSSRYLSTRTAALVHVGLLIVTFALALPIRVSDTLGLPPADREALWLLGIFALSMGLPFFAVAGNGPLLQAWFSRSGHKQAADPYFLYGASNLGSFAALIAYPVVIEPFVTLHEQAVLWDAGFALLAAAIAGGAMLIGRQAAGAERRSPVAVVDDAPIDLRRRLAWIGLALVPSGLLVAVTAHISTDIASAPFLWIVPLSLFLLTFVAVFRERPLIPHRWVALAWPVLAAVLCVTFYWLGGIGIALALHLVAFFAAALLCHGELYRRRPSAAHLTEFYLWMSFGGVLGGCFASLISPVIFNGIYEYPILIVLALACLPAVKARPWRSAAVELLVMALATLCFLLAWPAIKSPILTTIVMLTAAIGGAVLIVMERRTPLRSAGFAAMTLLVLGAVADSRLDHSIRSFFGVNQLVHSEDGRFRDLVHGNTVHGTMRLRNADGTPTTGRPEPLAYYSFGGGIDQALGVVRQAHGGTLDKVAVAGLGAGSLACQVHPGEAWTFFEIDPSVIRMAEDRHWFRFISDCAPDVRILSGDARLMLARQPETYRTIVLDAFSSDSIPVHLLTEEAFGMYLDKLAPDGAIVMNTSNRYLDISGLVAVLARHFGLSAAVLPKAYAAEHLADLAERKFPTEVVMLSRDPKLIDAILTKPGWQPLVDTGAALWTDDFSNVLGAMLRKK